MSDSIFNDIMEWGKNCYFVYSYINLFIYFLRVTTIVFHIIKKMLSVVLSL